MIHSTDKKLEFNNAQSQQQAATKDENDKGETTRASNITGFDEELETECSICLFAKKEIVLPHCGHAFCEPCIKDWWKQK